MVSLTNKTLTTPSVSNGTVSSPSVTDGVGATTVTYGYSGAGNIGRSFLNFHKTYQIDTSTSVDVTSVRLRLNVVTASGEATWGFYHLKDDDEMELHWSSIIDFTEYSTGIQYITFTPGNLVLPEGTNIFFIIGNVANTIYEQFNAADKITGAYSVMPSQVVTDYYDDGLPENPDYYIRSSGNYPLAMYIQGFPIVSTNSDSGENAQAYVIGSLNRTGGGSYTSGASASYLFGRPFELSDSFVPTKITATMSAVSGDATVRVRGGIYTESGVLIARTAETGPSIYYDLVSGDNTPDCSFSSETLLNPGSYYMVFQVEYDSVNGASLYIKTQDGTAIDSFLQRPVTYGDQIPSTIVFNATSRTPHMQLTYKLAPTSNTTFDTTWKDQTQTWAATTETWGDLVDYTDVTNTT